MPRDWIKNLRIFHQLTNLNKNQFFSYRIYGGDESALKRYVFVKFDHTHLRKRELIRKKGLQEIFQIANSGFEKISITNPTSRKIRICDSIRTAFFFQRIETCDSDYFPLTMSEYLGTCRGKLDGMTWHLKYSTVYSNIRTSTN